MIAITYILAVFGVLRWSTNALPWVDPKTIAAHRGQSRQSPTNMTRNRRSLPISDIFLETSSFTIVNQHESPVKMMLTRGCDGSPGGAGWSPFPLLFASDGTEYDESSLLGFQGAGGDCADPEQAIHLDLGEIDTDDNMEFVVPIGWHGKISFADAEYQMTGMSETLLEGSFGYQDNGYGYESLKLDFDVSFVDGFTLPMTCSCGGPVLAGCSWDLLEMNQCPPGYLVDGSCSNPLRGNNAATYATDFFKPCQGAAYTFPNDHQSNINGNLDCERNGVVCCIGSSCDPHQTQCTGDLFEEEEACAAFR